MAYRCQSCGHFAGLDEPELEVYGEGFDGETFSVSVSASFPSSCCGDVVATANYELNVDVGFKHRRACAALKEGIEEYSYEMDEPQATDRFQVEDAKGKMIPSRFQRHFYGVGLSGAIICESCKVSATFEASDESGPPDEV